VVRGATYTPDLVKPKGLKAYEKALAEWQKRTGGKSEKKSFILNKED